MCADHCKMVQHASLGQPLSAFESALPHKNKNISHMTERGQEQQSKEHMATMLDEADLY